MKYHESGLVRIKYMHTSLYFVKVETLLSIQSKQFQTRFEERRKKLCRKYWRKRNGTIVRNNILKLSPYQTTSQKEIRSEHVTN